MKKRIWIISGTVILAVVITVCIFVKRNQPEKVYMSASWMYGYADVEDLADNSDLIALVHVNRLSQSIDGRVPASIYEVTVLDGILGCEKGDILSVYMTGGRKGDQIFEIKSDPLMKKGQEFLIFAGKNQDGTCTVLGGPQGRLVYSKGMLNSLKYTKLPYMNTKGNPDQAEISKFDGVVDVQNESMEEIKGKINSVLQNKRE